MNRRAGSRYVQTLRLILAVEIKLYREGLDIALGAAGGLTVVGTAASAEEAFALARELRPDVALVDVSMCAGLAAVEALSGREEIPVVALAVPQREPDVVACVEAGAVGFVTCEATLGDLVAAIESVARGETLCSPRIVALVVRRLAALAADSRDARPVARLTTRELEIIELIDIGLSNKEIAACLSICVSTVKNHVHNILEKLSVRRRAEAAACIRTSSGWQVSRLDRRPTGLSEPSVHMTAHQ
jgi:DNA-binding NarL/FixJ family response regulator